MKNSLLVIGGTGFIGKHAAIRALKEGYQTFILCRNIPPKSQIIDQIEYIKIDLNNSDEIKKISNYSFNYVINLAGDIDHCDFRNGGLSLIDIHLYGLIKFLSILPKNNLKGFVQIGSSDEYGDSIAPQKETQKESPFSPYSYAKFAATHFIKFLYRNEQFPGKVLRPFLIYGPGQDENRLIPYVINNAFKNNVISITSGDQLRDFLYIEDALDVIFLALTNDKANGKVINIGSGKPYSVKEIVEMIINLIGTGKPKYGSRNYRRGQSMKLYPSIGLAKEILNWEPKFSLEEGLKEFINLLKK